VAALRARVDRLLGRGQERLAEELDLAEAICALRWPKWPAYGGSIDLLLLRRALAELRLNDATLNWLGSQELTLACRSPVKLAQGP
jgi:hypothetical protein